MDFVVGGSRGGSDESDEETGERGNWKMMMICVKF
jgi:hypothetical protein